VRASGLKTSQPTPSLTPQTALVLLGTPQRLSSLRGQCLLRDHHRCAITRRFDASEARSRSRHDGEGAKDDDGRLLIEEEDDPALLEVSHIIPHSLMSINSRNETELVCPIDLLLLQILTMFKEREQEIRPPSPRYVRPRNHKSNRRPGYRQAV
jgi:HNH endonuclease